MFKSCDYCRHRRKRCVTAAGRSRCSDCEHLDLPCEFSQRQPSLKRRQTSRQIAARLSAERAERTEKTERTQADLLGTAFAAEGVRRRVQQADSRRSGKINKALFERQAKRDDDDDGSAAADKGRRNSHGSEVYSPLHAKYVHDVQPFLPFVPPSFFIPRPGSDNSLLNDCVARACALSLHAVHAQPAGNAADLDAAVIRQSALSLADCAGLLLLMPCLPFSETTVEHVLDMVASHGHQQRPHHQQQQRHRFPELLAGAISLQAWRQLVNRSNTFLWLPTDMLHDYAMSLDERSFARHYLLLADLGARVSKYRSYSLDGHDADTDSRADLHDPDAARRVWAALEYECLLWQVRLPPHLLDLRDELPATPESLVIHQLSNLVLLSLYQHVLLDRSSLGESIALRPVPGVLYFLCALARSVFICPRPVLDRWDLIVDIQAMTARILLQLWIHTHFENCRAILDMWTDVEPRHQGLAARVRAEIGTGPWTVDEIDGYSVFWTFRDLRTLTLELIVGHSEKKQIKDTLGTSPLGT
ncbi:hypothetical protein SCUCBS95973_007354 [Sporothrix curviconia]|uniref:Zn(2)-C6 fungal-type domain-containing protein n=1 Tax=Sporothrix curviconia TaxID=1260050 RepID=A0ABP0CCQ0_9PEZI